MLSYVFIGLALGAIYAMSAASLVVTYESAGILNFAFGAMAFFVAKFFYWSNTTHGWNLAVAGIVSLLIVAPALGIVAYLAVFQFLRHRSTLIKVVASIGVSVALPAVAIIAFGNETISQANGLAPQPVKYWNVLGATLNLNQVIIYAFLVVVVGVGSLVLRFTDVGLKVRATVDSEALTSLSGVNPGRVAFGVWAVSGMLAGSAGVLAGPTIGVNVSSMTMLMASSFAAVVAARLRRLGMAVGVALAMGVVTDGIQDWLPQNSVVTSDIVQCVPFVFILSFLVLYLVRGKGLHGERPLGGALDTAIRAGSGDHIPASRGGTHPNGGAASWRSLRTLVGGLPLVVIALLPLLLSGYWLGLTGGGIALAIVFLSFSLVTGDGGMTWLCQVTFAGGGALLAAELTSGRGVDPLLATLIGAVAMVPVGVLIGALTIRLGDLYVALVTLTFGLLIDTVVFSDSSFSPGLGGVTMLRPAFAGGDRSFAYFALVVFAVVGVAIVNLRRSTTGLAIGATRWSDPAARTIGLNVIQLRLILAGVAAFVAGLGGALFAMYSQSTDPSTYNTFTGLVWLAVLVTVGVRSLTAALVAGLAYTLVPALFSSYLPTGWLQVPSVLFGLGAIGLALNPEGVVAMYARQLRNLIFGRNPRPAATDAAATAGDTMPAHTGVN